MAQCIRFEIVCKVAVVVPTEGVSADELVLSMSTACDELGTRMVSATVEGIQRYLLERSRLPKAAAAHECWSGQSTKSCSHTTFVKQGQRGKKRELRTPMGTISFPVHYVGCKRCGTKYPPILKFLGIADRQRHLTSLEKVVAEVVSLETYGKAEGLVQASTTERVPDATMHDWIANVDWDELELGRYRRAQTVMTDGTGFKKRGPARGDLRVMIGLDGRNKPFAMGVWAGKSWKEIGPEVKERIKGRVQSSLFVHDGEVGISEHLAGVAAREARCRWHMPRGQTYALWGDDVPKEERDKYAGRLSGILGIEIPADDWQELKPVDLEPLRDELRRAKERYQELTDEFGRRGYAKAREYLAGAVDHVFTQVETWLDTGVVLPGTTTVLERIMRELGRRLKKLGYGWSDEGLTRIATILLKKTHEPEDWDRYWNERMRISGLCTAVVCAVAIGRPSMVRR
jgi:hypothetical protein